MIQNTMQNKKQGNIKSEFGKYGKQSGEWFLLCLSSVLLGAGIGAIDALFGRVLLAITDIRGRYPLYFVPFLAIAGVIIVFCYEKYGAGSQKGMGLVFDVGHGKEGKIPFRLIPFVMIGTWMTHLFGGSAGREGVAVQIGATVSHWFGKHVPIKRSSRLFLVIGMAAGFSGLFRTPLAATFFAMEVLTVGILEYKALIPALLAAFTSCNVSAALGLEKFYVPLDVSVPLNTCNFFKLLGLGILFGGAGTLFARGLKRAKDFLAKKMPQPVVRIAVTGALLSIIFLGLHMGRYSGLGTNLISASFQSNTIYPYDWALKIILTILTLAAGFQGGEVTPLFSIGASLGVVLAPIFGLPVLLVAALGYASVFGSATNTLLAPIFIGVEVFGYAYLPYFVLVSAVAFAINGNRSIYGAQQVYHE